MYYTPEAREAEYELLPAGEELGIGAMIWSPLGQGLFGGKAASDGSAPKGTRQGAEEWNEPYLPDRERFAKVLKAIEAVADEVGRSIPQVTLAWTRSRPTIGAIVLGARNERQLADNLASYDLRLTLEQAARIEAAGRPRPLYPFWHRAMWGLDRPTASEREYLEGHRRTVGA
jgi:aryl-alcohol dehydrogenase-like predicted oxidoreductase